MVKIFYLCRYRNACVICYCDESQKKSKAVFEKIRIFDRTNTPYPELTIRSLYVLNGGYKTFYKNYPQLCVNNEVAQNTSENIFKQFFLEFKLIFFLKIKFGIIYKKLYL